MPRLRPVVMLTGALIIASSVVACTTPAPAPSIDTQSPPVPGQVERSPELYPEGSAEQNLEYFHHSLQQFALGEQPVQGQPVVEALAAAGFDKSSMQVSFDLTKSDLTADAIFVSVRIGEQCLLGQLMTGDRSVATVVEPTVGPERNICLIGNTRAIDW